MGVGSDRPHAYLIASSLAAVVNFPLWKASAMAQSGFAPVSGGGGGGGYAAAYAAALKPPYRGVFAVVAGMTWARFAIFYGSDVGRRKLERGGAFAVGSVGAVAAPPVLLSTAVQVINQPVIRGSIALQDPSSSDATVRGALARIAAGPRGAAALWHGTSAGVLKTVPKYCVAILVKDYAERALPPAPPGDEARRLGRAAVKASSAALAGALLTNPLDVVRNEMFKTDAPLTAVVRDLHRSHPNFSWALRGADKNLVGVAVPVAITIFVVDALQRFGL